MSPRDWLEAYRRAWEEADVEGAVALFTEAAVYRSDRDAGGHAGPRRRAGSRGNRVAAEWWTTVRSEGEEVTLPGCLVLRFAADGRCEELREYWHVEPGTVEPPPGWGV